MDTRPAPLPQPVLLPGKHVCLEPLRRNHADGLWPGVGSPELWDYMAEGPFASEDAFRAFLESIEASRDPLFYVIVDRATGSPLGYASLMRIDPPNRVIEVGNIMYTPSLQRSRAATEAMYLLARYVFDDLGYRRYEWKCNALNLASRRAAARLGFVFEGLFRQHRIVKGRNRDTTWFSILDREWPRLKARFETWLDPGNFDANGRQIRRLQEC